MAFPRTARDGSAALLAFPELMPAGDQRAELRVAAPLNPVALPKNPGAEPGLGRIRASVLSFQNMHLHGELLVNFLRERKRTFIDKLHWSLPHTEGMEFDQYDTPEARWLVVHEYGEILAGMRMMPTTSRCGIYTYMLRDAQKGLLTDIPTDVMFFEAPQSKWIWEATRLFISDDVPARRRVHVETTLMELMRATAVEAQASHVLGIVPAAWSRWARRIGFDAVPAGPRFTIDRTSSQAVLFNTSFHAPDTAK